MINFNAMGNYKPARLRAQVSIIKTAKKFKTNNKNKRKQINKVKTI